MRLTQVPPSPLKRESLINIAQMHDNLETVRDWMYVSIIYWNWYAGFRLVPKAVTLNGLERNGRPLHLLFGSRSLYHLR